MRGGGLRVESEKVAIDPTIPHSLWIELGSLYPPLEHPFWIHLDSVATQDLRNRIRVALDERVLIDGHAPQWDTVQAEPALGDISDISDADHRFTGTFIKVNRIRQPLR